MTQEKIQKEEEEDHKQIIKKYNDTFIKYKQKILYMWIFSNIMRIN